MLIVSDACFVFAYNDDGRCAGFPLSPKIRGIAFEVAEI
jgi:hypothetical protein